MKAFPYWPRASEIEWCSKTPKQIGVHLGCAINGFVPLGVGRPERIGRLRITDNGQDGRRSYALMRSSALDRGQADGRDQRNNALGTLAGIDRNGNRVATFKESTYLTSNPAL